MARLNRLLCCALLALVPGCAGFELEPPADFVKLDPDYYFAMRATSADGVVLAVRELDDEREGSLAFWADAVQNRLRDEQGYALVEAREVTAASGEAGKQLRLGRDQGNQRFDYWVTVFVAPGGLLSEARVLVVEAGGLHEPFARLAGDLERAIASFTIR